ncbi:MAG TPA: methionine synthase, partial [Candidatus Limnocylindria bacterium]|nr:methionine synthase [Candidatus Limnocylindria bacterium]
QVVAGLRAVIDALPPDVVPVVHCCAPEVPVGLLVRAGARALSVDLSLLGHVQTDALGGAVEAGVQLVLGVVDPRSEPSGLSDPAATVAPVRALWSRLGFPAERISEVVITPTCGLAGASPAGARHVLGVVGAAAQRLAEDPFGDLDGRR